MDSSVKEKILFVAWDNPKSNYLEGLFLPVFARLQEYGFQFHILQFSWADQDRIEYLTKLCANHGINYQHVRILQRPVAAVGKFLTTLSGSKIIDRYIRAHNIDMLMPRSTMPASMSLPILKKLQKLKVVFDADGLPIEERVDFAGLRKGSFRYRHLKSIEKKILHRATAVLTRTRKAAEILSSQHGISLDKFFVVENGRDEIRFNRKQFAAICHSLRTDLGIPNNAFVNVYCGSLGPQYGAEQMLEIHRRLVSRDSRFYFLILTNNPSFLDEKITGLKNMVIRNVPAADIPKYLSVADVGFAIRKATYSMQAVAPIKIAEYLMMGLGVVASSGIGDTDTLLKEKPFAIVLSDYSETEIERAVTWILSRTSAVTGIEAASRFGEEKFSLSKSVQSYLTAIRAAQ